MERITEETKKYEKYIHEQWKYLFETKKEIFLRELLPEPKNSGLKHIWKYGADDLVVYRNGKIVCVIEPGGSHHFQDEKQMKNDRRKWKLHEINGIKLLRIANGVFDQLSNRKKRQLLGKFLF